MDDIRRARNIVREECELVGLSPGELRDAPRTKNFVRLRHTILMRLRAETGLSFRECALLLGYASRPSKQYYRLTAKSEGVIHTTTTTTG